MHALAAFSAPLHLAEGHRGGSPSAPETELERLRRLQREGLRALAAATNRAERAERRLRARLLQLTWPATLAGFAGGFAAIVLLRLVVA